MKIIIDSGATKTTLRMTDLRGGSQDFCGEGINFSTMSADMISERLERTVRNAAASGGEDVTDIHFYAAGFPSQECREKIVAFLGSVFPKAGCEIQTDMLGAARALCGRKPGIAAILGTGSNSCLYDGHGIIGQVCSGGYILGDEGSASRLGRIFISDHIKGLTPPEIREKFIREHQVSASEIIDRLYRKEASPSGFLGSFSPFIISNYEHPYIQQIVDDNFNDFFTRVIAQYGHRGDKVGIVGGFGYACREIIEKVAERHSIEIGAIIRTPMDALTEYHSQKG